MAPCHYINQCWNIVNWTLRNKRQWNLNRNSNIHENALEKVVCGIASILSRPQRAKAHVKFGLYSDVLRAYRYADTLTQCWKKVRILMLMPNECLCSYCRRIDEEIHCMFNCDINIQERQCLFRKIAYVYCHFLPLTTCMNFSFSWYLRKPRCWFCWQNS